MKISMISSALFSLLTLTGAACTTNAIHPKAKIYSFESDANGFNTKNYFYDNGEEVIAFDAQFTPELAQKSIEFLRTKTNNKITYLIITHPNPDKFNGIEVFRQAGAKIVASAETQEKMKGVYEYKKYYFTKIAHMFSDESYPKLGVVNQTFVDELALELKNGEIIKLKELDFPGVSTNQTVALIPNLNALMVGDLIHPKAHAWLEGGIVDGTPVPTIESWIKDLEQLQAMFNRPNEMTVFPGRGEQTPLDQAVAMQVKYLEKAQDIVKDYLATLGSKKVELSGPKAGEHYQAIQKLFVKEFPDYSLDYMIGYGVYGLVNQLK